ncbi:DNA polymerase III, delta prime subunit [Desulfonispora thiosulfatigenes DSM 11270]|uniref:DNA polymerase III subunit delta' n=1 Tax=Desulfonispora thiosulfatigenes DSM 11270 TaxID=656914 RepID=A0A1W1V0V9_DESTI|nr:DNA polymerase III subunit delta' [Desulfonispora thiosulfatigenes]SMB86946.1 DNA polymerase III, delta prime subunit [Desulfonispora thiosulfatigenes DSM 11270]
MSFENIKGQDRAISLLKKSILNKRIAHAYLFTGIEGIGKKTSALALAKALNCLEPINGGGCQECLSCRKIESGNHPDVKIIEPDGTSIKIEQIRELRNKVFFMSYEGNYKVIILDDAHLMTIEAFNSLLKVLEEPPQKTIFILITDKPQQLPDTILSRCQNIQFMPLDSKIIKELITTQNPECPDNIEIFSKLARGSLKKASEVLNEGELQLMRKELLEILTEIKTMSLSHILLWCNKWEKDRKGVKVLLELIQFWFRDLLIWKTTNDESLIINYDYMESLKQDALGLDEIYNALKLIHKGLRDLNSNVNPRLLLDVLLLKIKSA